MGNKCHNGKNDSKSSIIKVCDTIVKPLVKVEDISIVILFILMITVSFLQVLFRYIIKISAPWTEELSRYAMIYLVMFGAAWAIYADNHIKIDLIYTLIKNRRARIIISLATSLLTLAFCAFFAYGAFLLIPQVISSNLMSVSLNIPMWIPQFAVVVGGTLMTIHYICVCIGKIDDLINYCDERGEN